MPLDFDGVDDYVDFGNPSVLPDGANPRSCSLWVRTTTTSGAFAWAFAYGRAVTSQGFGIGRAGDVLFGIGVGDDITSAGFFTANQWHHTAHTYDGTTARLYGDGVEVASGAKTWPLVRLEAIIGRKIDAAPTQHWTGQIDDVRVYDRVLSADEIAEIHALRGKDRIDDGLVFGARLDEFPPGASASGAGSVEDRSGNGNNGTPVNTPTGAEGILSFGRLVA